MPLKAKINNPAFSSGDKASAEDETDVLFSSTNSLRKVTLNRPKKLNSLNLSMIEKIHPRLEAYATSPGAKLILINGNGRAFCAGGDVAALATTNKQGNYQVGKDYFAAEYRLDHMIATYKKPIVAVADGICMGGGVGLTINAPIRVITEKTVFAMPESTIGFFPDVGASRFLASLGNVGKYLACTAERLTGAQVVLGGLGTHYVPSERLAHLEARLTEMDTSDLAAIRNAVSEFTAPIDEAFVLEQHKEDLKAFEQPTIPKVLEQLDQQSSTFSKQTAKTMRAKSPISLAVALQAQQQGKGWNINEVFEREYNIAAEFMHNPDFVEGVEATLIHRKPAEWHEKSFDVNVDKYFRGRARLF
ncbi:ClpP/crotonase-like domain-containing protein [Protomyces lactucae-debilis]|uniref:3-hydroxyisobutyryl-CoA hydrolase n=1 Tax=Protomyces lactucae-debilis TaxID=2754530 RepID=A0A1Y2EU95_PROLT|nr:ClpP/crotonase-like domain-containing protein [Protomyces lactucae-debilis]ORY75151.1 ClpP/crotonase-like domain-containing protein [Protomyces lactucae-debilis]